MIDLFFFWLSQAKDDEQVCVEVAKVEGAGCEEGARLVTNENDMRCSVIDEDLWGISCVRWTCLECCARLCSFLHTHGPLNPSDLLFVYNLSNCDLTPVSASVPHVLIFWSWRVVEHILDGRM